MKIEGGGLSAHPCSRRCLARKLCPIQAVCAAGVAEDCPAGRVYPTMLAVDKGEVVWADQRFEQRAFLIQEGIFSCVSNPKEVEEAPFAVFGCGEGTGLAELYVDRTITSMYHLRALTPGLLCSVPAKALRHCLEGLPRPQSERLLSCAFMNNSGALYFQTRLLAKVKTSERLTLLFARLAQLGERGGRPLDEVCLSHEELASLVGADRASTTRALHRMEEDGLVELGYRSVRLLEAFEALSVPEVEQLDAFRTCDSPEPLQLADLP